MIKKFKLTEGSLIPAEVEDSSIHVCVDPDSYERTSLITKFNLTTIPCHPPSIRTRPRATSRRVAAAVLRGANFSRSSVRNSRKTARLANKKKAMSR